MQVSSTALAFFLVAAVACGQAEHTVPSHVREVTLYRGQAMVTRIVEVPARSGPLELVVTDLPLAILPDSLFAESSAGTEVRAVRYRQRAVGEEPREEVRLIVVKLAELNGRYQEIQMGLKLLQQRMASLDRLDAFVANQANADLNKGRLDAEALQKMVTFTFTHRKEAMQEDLELQRKATAVKSEMQLLERQRAEIASASSRNVREAVLFVDKAGSETARVRLSYLVTSCGWLPSYTLRADREQGQVELDYNALITQATGESWTGVQFTLSTATPALSAAGPVLAPFTVALTRDSRQNGAKIRGMTALESELRKVNSRQVQAQTMLGNATKLTDNLNFAWAANSAASELQCLEITAGDVMLRDSFSRDSAVAEGPSLTYALEGSVSLASRNDQQMVRIARKQLSATFAHMAIPVLSPHVYREASVLNNSGLDLLKGPVSVYLDRRFVGRAELDSVAEGQTFNVGLGADPRLRTYRELANRTQKVQGGNRVLEVGVRLRVENFYGEAVPVRIYDRLPNGRTAQELQLTVGKHSHPLSKDKEYLRTERSQGILRWDVEVPARAQGESSLVVTHDYRLEFDRNLELTNLDADPQSESRKQFEQYFRGRQSR